MDKSIFLKMNIQLNFEYDDTCKNVPLVIKILMMATVGIIATLEPAMHHPSTFAQPG